MSLPESVEHLCTEHTSKEEGENGFKFVYNIKLHRGDYYTEGKKSRWKIVSGGKREKVKKMSQEKQELHVVDGSHLL